MEDGQIGQTGASAVPRVGMEHRLENALAQIPFHNMEERTAAAMPLKLGDVICAIALVR